MNALKPRSPRHWTAVLLVLAALAATACGSNSGGSSNSSSSSPPASTQSSGSSSSNAIPQGANAGDADSDNHGGPSDGDGNM